MIHEIVPWIEEDELKVSSGLGKASMMEEALVTQKEQEQFKKEEISRLIWTHRRLRHRRRI